MKKILIVSLITLTGIVLLLLNIDMKRRNYKFAIVQLDSKPGQVEYNVINALRWGRQAFDNGADFVLFHEGLTADYTSEPTKYARSLDSDEVNRFINLASKFNGQVVLGLNELKDNKAYISMVFCGPEGVEAVYRKSYLWPNDNQVNQMGYETFEDFMKVYDPQKQGYRCERATFGAGNGTLVFEIDGLSIGCLICADGTQQKAWQTFERERPDVIFWQNNRGSALRDGAVKKYSSKLRIPVLASNRVGYSHQFFQKGGSCACADDGSYVVKANEEGKEQIIYCDYKNLKKNFIKGQ